jgi:hypothetical protein
MASASIEVDVFLFDGESAEFTAPDWFTQGLVWGKVSLCWTIRDGHRYIYGCKVKRRDGTWIYAKNGDYIVHWTDGELWVCTKAQLDEGFETITPGK